MARDDFELHVSEFLDLDPEDSFGLSTDEGSVDFNTLPFSEELVRTGQLTTGLEKNLESYISRNRLSRRAKKTLRSLAAENDELEAEVSAIEDKLIAAAMSYHKIVSIFMEEKTELEAEAISDEDPYDSRVVSVDRESLGALSSREEANELFEEMSALEEQRRELNAKRRAILTDARATLESSRANSYGSLLNAIDEKILAIGGVQDITKAKFTVEEEKSFDRDLEEFQKYVVGDFDPLEEEDDYDLPQQDISLEDFSEEDFRSTRNTPTENEAFDWSVHFGGSAEVGEAEEANAVSKSAESVDDASDLDGSTDSLPTEVLDLDSHSEDGKDGPSAATDGDPSAEMDEDEDAIIFEAPVLDSASWGFEDDLHLVDESEDPTPRGEFDSLTEEAIEELPELEGVPLVGGGEEADEALAEDEQLDDVAEVEVLDAKENVSPANFDDVREAPTSPILDAGAIYWQIVEELGLDPLAPTQSLEDATSSESASEAPVEGLLDQADGERG